MIHNKINQIRSILSDIGSEQNLPSSFKKTVDNNLNNIENIYSFGKPSIINQELSAHNECPVCHRSFEEFSGIKSQIISFNEKTHNAFKTKLGRVFNMVNSLEKTVLFNRTVKQVTIEPMPNRCSACGRNY